MRKYLSEYVRAIDTFPLDAIAKVADLLLAACAADRTIFVCGNGGSAATADHFACDLNMRTDGQGGKHFRAVSLVQNVASLTAAANDHGYADLFAVQLSRMARPGDFLFCLSVSGDSPNIVTALRWARKNQLITVGLGSRRGGALAELAEHVVLVDDAHFGRVEDAHMQICHLLSFAIQDR